MLKILILSHRFSPQVGGIETNSEILASAFHHYGAKVHLITWTKGNGADRFPFKVIRNPSLFTLLSEHRWADIIFENNPSLRLSWPNIFFRKPLVIAVNTWLKRITGYKGVRDRLKNLWFRRAKSVIAVSDAIREKEWEQAVVIENAYDNSVFKIMPGVDRAIPFVFLGRLVSDKGADQAIKAVSVLAKENMLDKNQVQLMIIGDGPEKEKLLSLREELDLCGAIHFTGVLKGKELVECLNRHRFILVPSIWEEPYGNVVLEGMACGCTPVVSNGGGMPAAVGDAGFIFKRNDLDDMINVLKYVIKCPEKAALVKKNAKAHLEKHSLELVAQQYFKILNEAVGR